MIEIIKFNTEDGLLLTGILQTPDKPTSKAVILAHGITVDKDESGIFIRMAEIMMSNGIASFRFDFRGHGESQGKSADMTIAKELVDLKAAHNYVKKRGFNITGLLGASFGGGISVLYAAEHISELNSLCLWNPALNYDHTFLNPTLPWLKQQKDIIQKDFDSKGWTEFGSRKFILGKELFEQMKRFFPYQALNKITIPAIIIHGDKDTKVSFDDSKLYSKSLVNGKFIPVLGAEHGFHVQVYENEVLNITLNFFKEKLYN